MMEIIQNDILGNKHQTKNEKAKKASSASSKEYVDIGLKNGINEYDAIDNAMLIHRVLQRKLIYRGLSSPKDKAAFLKIFKNELKIKSGQIDPASAVRDSLIEFYIKLKAS